LQAFGWMALSAVLFALMNFFARLASAHASWAIVGASRALLGAAVAWGVGRARGAPLVAGDRKGMWLRSLFGTGSMLATFYALSSRTLPLGDTVSLIYLTPVFVAVLAPSFLGEKTSKGIVLAIALSLAGVVLIFRPAAVFGGASIAGSPPAEGPSALATAVVAVTSALFAAVAMMMLRRVGQHESPEAIALHFSLVAAAIFVVVALADRRAPLGVDAVFTLIAGLAGGFAQLALTRAYSLDRAARVGAMGYLSVVASALLGAVALHERPQPLAIAGMVLVVAGGVVVTSTARPKPTARDSSSGERPST
jgi:drug/metabolite transporter (DMT)-like permease